MDKIKIVEAVLKTASALIDAVKYAVKFIGYINKTKPDETGN